MKLKSMESFYKWSSIVGVILILFPEGPAYYWGNLYVYYSSYILNRLDTDDGVYAPWILAIKKFVSAILAVSAASIQKYIGNRVCIFIGIACMCANNIVAYYTIQNSSVLFTVLYGLLYGIGTGLLINTVMDFALQWVDKKKTGFYIAFCRCGKFFGSIVANQYIVEYVNPDNFTPDTEKGPTSSFSQKEILDRVPSMFLYLGLGFFFFEFTGLLLVKSKKDSKPLATQNNGIEENGGYNSIEAKEMENGETSREFTEHRLNGNTVPHTPSSLTVVVEVEEEKEDIKSYTVIEMLKTSKFYGLFIAFTLSFITDLVINNYYKSFGQIWIEDDHFLAMVGTFIPVANIIASIILGKFMDRVRVKSFLVFFSAALALVSMAYYFTPFVNKWLFVIGTWLFSSLSSVILTVYNIATIQVFGRKHQTSNVGVMQVSALGDLVFSPVVEAILLQLGWFYVFMFTCILNILALLFIVVLA